MTVATYDTEIATLQAFLDQDGLDLRVEATSSGLAEFDAVDLMLGGPDAIRFTVFDEYGDLVGKSALLALVLLRFELDELDEATCESWARAQALDADLAAVQATWARNCAARDTIASRFGQVPDVVTGLDWELNAGLAQFLRRGS